MNKPKLKTWTAPMILDLDHQVIKSGGGGATPEYVKTNPGCMKQVVFISGMSTIGPTFCS